MLKDAKSIELNVKVYETIFSKVVNNFLLDFLYYFNAGISVRHSRYKLGLSERSTSAILHVDRTGKKRDTIL